MVLIAMMTVVVEVMAAGMVAVAATMTAIVHLVMTTVVTDAETIMGPATSIVTLPAAMTATAAVEMIDAEDPTTILVTADVAMVEILLLREIHTAEVKTTRTATIGTLVVRLRSANPPRYGALLEIVHPHLAARPVNIHGCVHVRFWADLTGVLLQVHWLSTSLKYSSLAKGSKQAARGGLFRIVSTKMSLFPFSAIPRWILYGRHCR